MTYVSESLGPGEEIVYKASLSWVTYVWAFLVAAVGVFAMFFSVTIGLALVVIGLVWFLVVRLHNNSIELAVTNHKVVAKTGLIARNTVEQRLEKIDAIDVAQTVAGRILGYGDVTIHGTGVDSTPIRMIQDPLIFRRKVEQAIEAKQAVIVPVDSVTGEIKPIGPH
jgi:uncharacterized membrane protein YdbT with pleckstrin-like domain